MPLTHKGRKIRAQMRREYGREKGDEVFYASINSGKIEGAEVAKSTHGLHRRVRRNG